MLTAASLESLLLQMLDRLDSPSPAGGRHRARQRGGGRCSLRAEIRTLDLWRAVVGECLATFFYVFLVCGAHVSWPGYAEPSVLAISLATGAAAAAVVQCYARVSGAHMNPAVTLAAFATRKVSPLRALLYVTAQCGGGIAGAALLYGVTLPGHRSSLGSSRPHEALGAWQAFGVEFVLSFLLASTVFATRDPHRCHLSTGGADALVVGFAYLTCTLAGLPASGASLNPARSLGPAFVMNKWKNHWVYWFGPVAGGLLAGLIYEYIFDTKRSSRDVGRRSVEDADKEYRLEDDYEDPSSAKNAKYATVSQSLNGGVASGSTARHARAAKAVRQQQQQQQQQSQQQQQYEAGCFGRPAANTYSPTPSLAFPSCTEAAYASTLAAANCTAQIYDLEMPSGHFRRAWSTDKDLDLQDSKLYI
ncbi:lens fiber major intrinsic protein-like [Dermacentor variabilis]|uniref:lens fiber major intrinsic protein-like n=1 Tax=Dermacentor variabilis TaxID=34621 RepID=UPI003F5BB89C